MKSKCCCICLPTRKQNTTDIKAFLSGLPSPDAECGAALAGGSLPLPRTDLDKTCYNDPNHPPSCGDYGMGKGEWPFPYPNQTFADSGTASPNVCGNHGFKVVQSKRAWNGRFGFIDDYVLNPKSATSKFKSANYEASFSENYSGTQNIYDGSGNFIVTNSGSGQHFCSTSSFNSLSIGGVSLCSPQMNYNDGGGNWIKPIDDPSFFNYFEPCSAINCNGDVQIPITMPQTGYQALIDSGQNTIITNKNKQLLKDITFIDADRSIVTFKIPWLKTVDGYQTYQGPISGVAAWIDGLNLNDDYSVCSNGEFDIYKVHRNFSVSKLELTNTKFSVTISCSAYNSYHLNFDDGNCAILAPKYYADYEYEGVYTATVNLGDENKSSDIESDCKSLLNQWDMTDDTVYPWRTDTECRVAPMVIRREAHGTAPSIGYCESVTDSNLLSKFDGSIYGAPLSAAYYDKGWFDFIEDEYHYQEDGKLCYSYGNYSPTYLPTTATHWTDGALDTGIFGRFIVNYQYILPPFVNHGCAFLANNQEAFWASKWAEIKEPLPSQNYWGECGLQPNQCAIDDHGGAFATCTPMRDLFVLDATTCEETTTIRYPNAFAFCGKIAISDISNSYGVNTVTHAKTTLLRTGDAVDFVNGINVTVSNIVVTVDSDTQFHFTGPIPYGQFIISHGSSADSQYDLSPKGDFVRVTDNAGTITAEQGNVIPYAGKKPIIAIVPPGSPEINNPKWPARSTVIYSDYKTILPTESWLSAIQQAMVDRFWIFGQDDKITDQGSPPTCAIKNKDGTACITEGCNPVLTPLVEARLFAPQGAPLQFTSDNFPEWIKMPTAVDFATNCSAVWLYGQPPATFYPQYGVNPGLASSDRTASSNAASSDSNASWGTADSTFIP